MIQVNFLTCILSLFGMFVFGVYIGCLLHRGWVFKDEGYNWKDVNKK